MAADQVPVQSVAPMQLPFASVKDLDCQHQWRHDQTLAKRQPSPLKAEQSKWAKMPPQPDSHDALDRGHTQTEERKSRDRGHSRVRGEDRQQELDRVWSKSRKRSKSRKWSKSRKQSKSRQQSKSKKRTKSHEHDEGRVRSKHEVQKPGVWPSQCKEERSGRSPSSTTQWDGWCAEQSAPSSEWSKFLKLKEVVVKHAQSYIQRHAMAICRSLTPDHEAVKCLSVFGEKAQKFAAEILAMIEWGTQHWKLQEPFPVPLMPRWPYTPEFAQTTMPIIGELPLIPTGTHFEDIHV